MEKCMVRKDGYEMRADYGWGHDWYILSVNIYMLLVE